MPQSITEQKFLADRALVLHRWCQLEALRIGHLNKLSEFKKRSERADNWTMWLAIATAVIAALQGVVPQFGDAFDLPHVKIGMAFLTALTGAMTAISSILKSHKNWEEKISSQREMLATIREGQGQTRQWVETASRGSVQDEDDFLLSRMDTLVKQILEEGIIDDYGDWIQTAQNSSEHGDLASIEFLPSDAIPANDTMPDTAERAGQTTGITRAIRG